MTLRHCNQHIVAMALIVFLVQRQCLLPLQQSWWHIEVAHRGIQYCASSIMQYHFVDLDHRVTMIVNYVSWLLPHFLTGTVIMKVGELVILQICHNVHSHNHILYILLVNFMFCKITLYNVQFNHQKHHKYNPTS